MVVPTKTNRMSATALGDRTAEPPSTSESRHTRLTQWDQHETSFCISLYPRVEGLCLT
jgi:hypothetical protein